MRRSLALDAFAAAEQIDAGGEATTDEQAETRSARALDRLVELATSDGRAVAPEVPSAGTSSRRRDGRGLGKACRAGRDARYWRTHA